MNFWKSNYHCKEIETLTFRMLFLSQGEFPGVKLSRTPYNLVAKRLKKRQQVNGLIPAWGIRISLRFPLMCCIEIIFSPEHHRQIGRPRFVRTVVKRLFSRVFQTVHLHGQSLIKQFLNYMTGWTRCRRWWKRKRSFLAIQRTWKVF